MVGAVCVSGKVRRDHNHPHNNLIIVDKKGSNVWRVEVEVFGKEQKGKDWVKSSRSRTTVAEESKDRTRP